MQRREWFADDGTAQMMITGGGPVGMLFVHTLGTARIDAGNARLTPTSVRKFALLLHLSAEPGRRVPRDVLRELIFPDSTEDNARHSLRELLYGFRRLGVRIDSDKHGMALASDAVASDYSELLAGDRPDPAKLAAAAGGFLPGYAPEHSEAYAEWLAGYRARATFEICKALLKELTRAKRVGDWAQAERAARACLALDPLNEEATLGLAEMLAIGGAKVAAVRLLDEYVKEVGRESGDLTVSAKILRRRISEQEVEQYRPMLELPFVGREREMGLLSDHFTEARHGNPRLVVVSGSAGIGKSRLVGEFSRLAGISQALVETVCLRGHSARQPLSPFAELIPRLLRLPGVLGCSPASLEQLRRATNYSDSGPAERGDLVPSIEGAVADAVSSISAEKPLVLIVEDAHWIDARSCELFCELTSSGADRVLVVMTSRELDLASKFPLHASNIFKLPLAPLDPTDIEHLARESVGTADPEVCRWIVRAAAGNPLFLASLILHYKTTGEKLGVPSTLTELICHRLSRIGVRPLTVLRMCAVLAEQCTIGRLVESLELPYGELFEALTELERHELVRLPGERVTTAHPLIDETVIAVCPPSLLLLMHKRTAEVLEHSQLNEPSPSLLWACANHWIAGGAKDQAISALRRYAEYALRIGQPHDTGLVLERIFELVETDEARAAIAREIARAYGAASVFPSAARWSSRANALNPIPHEHDEDELLELRSAVLSGVEVDAAEARLRTCVESGTTDAHRLEAGALLAMLAEIYDRPALIDDLRSALEETAGRFPTGSAERLNFRMMCEAAAGNVISATSPARALLGLAASLDKTTAARLTFNAAIVLWRAGSVDEALVALEDGFVMSCRAGILGLQLSIAADAAYLLHNAQEQTTARAWLGVGEQLSASSRRNDARWDHASMNTYIAIQEGDTALACRMFDHIPQLLLPASARPTRWLEACRTRLDVLCRVPVTRARIESLIERSFRDNGSGLESDFEVEAAWHALLASSQRTDAVELIRTHVARTSARYHPYSYGLQRILEELRILVDERKLGRITVQPRNPEELLALGGVPRACALA